MSGGRFTMGQIKPPWPVKLIVGMLTKVPDLFPLAQQAMEAQWGLVDIRSDVMPFTHTDYYTGPMGKPLLRQFVSFAQLIDPGALAKIKHQSNATEARIAASSDARSLVLARPINLDPGYIDPSKLVLATTKNYSHRIYIGRSMYAEATLYYHQGKWQGWPYTYPDYASGDYDGFLNEVRQKLMEQLSSAKQNT